MHALLFFIFFSSSCFSLLKASDALGGDGMLVPRVIVENREDVIEKVGVVVTRASAVRREVDLRRRRRRRMRRRRRRRRQRIGGEGGGGRGEDKPYLKENRLEVLLNHNVEAIDRSGLESLSALLQLRSTRSKHLPGEKDDDEQKLR